MPSAADMAVAIILEERQEFVTKIDKNSNYVSDGPWDSAEAEVTVTWEADVEYRDWGVEEPISRSRCPNCR